MVEKSGIISKYNNPEWRRVFPFPQSNEFFDLLQDRLSVCVENILFLGDTRFTLLINSIDRQGFKRYRRDESPEFIYAGLKKQRELLRENMEERWKISQLPENILSPAWDCLQNTEIEFEDSAVSSSFFKKILDGTYKLADTRTIQTLKSYFESLVDKYTEEQKAEKTILERFFNIEEDLFISIPLIGFGEIDGIVHIVFKKDLLNLPHITPINEKDKTGKETGMQLFPEGPIWTLIRAFIVEYDGLFLDWDQVGDNLEKITAIHEFVLHTVFKSDEFLDRRINLGKTEILRELKLRDYYRFHAEYFKKRFELGENIPGKIYQQYITNAVTAILIDSYAHNVSAHALSTLAWWFYRRADMLRNEELDWNALFEYLENDPLIDPDLLKNLRKMIVDRSEKRIQQSDNPDKDGLKRQIQQNEKDAAAIRPEDGRHIIRYPGSLAREIAQLLRFLTEKGAFWSGVTRDVNIGGKVSSLYSILWYDFVNNPFYLGSIAKTEDITKIKLRVIIYDDEPQNWDHEVETKFHKKSYKPENEGIFAEINLSEPRESLHAPDSLNPHEKTISRFVKKGEKFEQLRLLLKEVRIFFPGGVVGRHAFYTMIENEIRNVKHYNHDELKQIQKDGLTLAIGVEKVSLHNSIKHELYRMTVWLDTPTRLVNENGEHLIERKWAALDGEIFDKKTYVPLLGGTYQDKVCAGFLLNGNFSHVQYGDRNPDRDKSKDTGRDKQHYPWVRPACSKLEEKGDEIGVHLDYKISYNNPLKEVPIQKAGDIDTGEEEEIVEKPIIFEYLPDRGYLKKIFYVWRGEYMLEWTPEFAESIAGGNASWDNPSRYYIVHLPSGVPIEIQGNRESPENPLHTLRRRDGVVRIVKGAIEGNNEEERYKEAFKKWLHTLVGEESLYAQIVMREGNQPLYVLALKNDSGRLRFVKERLAPGYELDLVTSEVLAKTKEKEALKKEWELLIAHKENEAEPGEELCARYRNHGIYKSHFFPKTAPRYSTDDPLMMELFEVLATKVCIFDNRVHHRLRLDKDQEFGYHAFLRDKLKLAVFKETTPSPESSISSWVSALSEHDRDFLKSCHFLVMHLSFIESILPTEIKDIAAKDRSSVGLFIEKYVMPLIGEKRDNFFFVVTTGRGRNDWWTSLDDERYRDFSTFTIFRAIESLLTGIENSVSIKDDIELKFRIVKTLYGS